MKTLIIVTAVLISLGLGYFIGTVKSAVDEKFAVVDALQKTTATGVTNISSNFIGTWTLVKCIATEKDGKITYPYGENPNGQILYDAKGNMMVEIMDKETKKFSSPSPFQGTPDEIIPAYNGLMAYYGTYKILADSNLITHTIKACSFPNWAGQNQKRRYEFRNGQLILKTPSINSVQYELTWERN